MAVDSNVGRISSSWHEKLRILFVGGDSYSLKDSITDLSVYSSTPEEVKQRHLAHRSNNLEIAKMELLKKAVKQHKNISFADMYSAEEEKENDCMKQYNAKKFTAAPVVTLAPRAAEKECMGSNVINETYKTINPCSSSKSITGGPFKMQDKINIFSMADSKEDISSSSIGAAEIEQMFLCFQNNLHIGEENQDTPTLFSKSKGNVTGITSLILTTLEKINQKCIKACEDLVLEKKKTKVLKKEVAGLKEEINTLKISFHCRW